MEIRGDQVPAWAAGANARELEPLAPFDYFVPQTMPWLLGGYPRVSIETLKVRLRLHGVPWKEYYSIQLDDYLRMRRDRSYILITMSIPIVLIGVLGILKTFDLISTEPIAQYMSSGFFPITWLLYLAVFMTCLTVYLTVSLPRWWRSEKRSPPSPDKRFFRTISLVFTHGHHPVVTMNLIGSTARSLFVALKGGRWSWTSPPAVADRAQRLAQPLLDIDIGANADIESRENLALFSFLYDVVILVIVGREDIIPSARERYPALPHRADFPGERDTLYLDPMRQRSRWEVIKDFVLPLASWISLIVSIVALTVAATR